MSQSWAQVGVDQAGSASMAPVMVTLGVVERSWAVWTVWAQVVPAWVAVGPPLSLLLMPRARWVVV